MKPKQTLTPTTPAINTNSSPSSSTAATSTSAPVSYTTTSTPIVAPSEVLPNTAISDRPKVKSVSKKDSKNIRKVNAAAAAAASLQNSQMAKAIAASPLSMPLSSTEQSLLQQTFSNFGISPSPNQQAGQLQTQPSSQQQSSIQTPIGVTPQTESAAGPGTTQPSQNLVVNPNLYRTISKQLNLQQALGGVVNAAAASAAADAVNRATNELLQFSAGRECNEQIAPNENILQLVAQIPNHPFQKIAQSFLSDQSKLSGDSKNKNSNSECHSDSI